MKNFIVKVLLCSLLASVSYSVLAQDILIRKARIVDSSMDNRDRLLDILVKGKSVRYQRRMIAQQKIVKSRRRLE